MTQTQPTSSVPAGSLVLTTGLAGLIATHTAKLFLERGYRVRGTVRDLGKAAWLTDDLFKSYAASGALELAHVPDMMAPNALAEALKGAAVVISTVMPWPDSQDPDACIDAAVAGTRVVLEAALAEPSVKEVVVTSSVTAVSMFPGGVTEVAGRDTYNELSVEILKSLPPQAGELREFIAYCVAKMKEEKEVWKFVKERQPAFNVSTVVPGLVLGKPLNAAHMGRSKAIHPTGIVTSMFVDGLAEEKLANHQSYFVDIHDIALLHLAAALDPTVKNERVHSWGEFHNWTEILHMLRKLYPDQKQIALEAPNQVSEATITTDMSLALQLLKKWGDTDGFRPFEQMVKDTIDPLVWANERMANV